MDYSQFFNMIPEAGLIAVLVIVFLADLILKGEPPQRYSGEAGVEPADRRSLHLSDSSLLLCRTSFCLWWML